MAIIAIFFGSFLAVFAAIVYSRHRRTTEQPSFPAMTKSDVDERIFSLIEKDFKSLNWSSWDASVHRVPGQLDRMRRAASSSSMSVSRISETEFEVVGESGAQYHVSEQGCSCPDFLARNLPCKHMYFVAMSGEGEIT